MSAHWAKPGVRCVFVRKSFNPKFRGHRLTYGGIYTIRAVVEHPKTGAIGLHLQEVVNEVHPIFGIELGYNACGFRPLVTRTQSQDIAEHFERFLTEPADFAPLDIPMLDEVSP